MPARRELGREAVVEAAAELIAAEGLENFSLRRLAAQLGVAAPAVSWHVGTRDALLLELTDRVLADVKTPPSGADTWLWVFARAFRSTVVGQRQLALVVLDLMPRAPRTLQLLAAVLDEIAGAGFAGVELIDRYNAYIGYVVGVTRMEVSQRAASPDGRPEYDEVRAAVAKHASPHVQHVFGADQVPLPVGEGYDSYADRSFARGLDALLTGFGIVPRM